MDEKIFGIVSNDLPHVSVKQLPDSKSRYLEAFGLFTYCKGWGSEMGAVRYLSLFVAAWKMLIVSVGTEVGVPLPIMRLKMCQKTSNIWESNSEPKTLEVGCFLQM